MMWTAKIDFNNITSWVEYILLLKITGAVYRLLVLIEEKKLRSLHGSNYLAQRKHTNTHEGTVLQRSGSRCLLYDF